MMKINFNGLFVISYYGDQMTWSEDRINLSFLSSIFALLYIQLN